jgi:hypothetical protein
MAGYTPNNRPCARRPAARAHMVAYSAYAGMKKFADETKANSLTRDAVDFIQKHASTFFNELGRLTDAQFAVAKAGVQYAYPAAGEYFGTLNRTVALPGLLDQFIVPAGGTPALTKLINAKIRENKDVFTMDGDQYPAETLEMFNLVDNIHSFDESLVPLSRFEFNIRSDKTRWSFRDTGNRDPHRDGTNFGYDTTQPTMQVMLAVTHPDAQYAADAQVAGQFTNVYLAPSAPTRDGETAETLYHAAPDQLDRGRGPKPYSIRGFHWFRLPPDRSGPGAKHSVLRGASRTLSSDHVNGPMADAPFNLVEEAFDIRPGPFNWINANSNRFTMGPKDMAVQAWDLTGLQSQAQMCPMEFTPNEMPHRMTDKYNTRKRDGETWAEYGVRQAARFFVGM